ncbi:unnamed protein product [Orchesella dallaii]|uniref:Uncharacterized protein n=1 Tax=Orchesella dallaii TaxID=48710 RepID=A0ABP1PQ66_9HEXA
MASKYGRNKTSKSKQSQEEETWCENFKCMNNVDVNSLKAKASQGSNVATGVLDNPVREKGDDEMKLRFCYIRFTTEPSLLDAFQMPVNVLALLKESVEMYPDNVHLHILPVGAYYCSVDFDLSSDSKAKRVDVITAFEEFLSKAPEDHHCVPKAYYHMTTAYHGEVESTNKYYGTVLQARERDRDENATLLFETGKSTCEGSC